MKTLFKSKALIFLMLASMLLASCGQENTTSNAGNTFSNSWGVNGTNGTMATFGGGSTGSQTLDMIFQQSSCQSSMGANAYSILAVSNQGGITQPITPNLSDITNVYVGRNLFGDVVVLRSMGAYAELIVKVCARSFLVGQGIQMGLQSAGDFVVNTSSYCSVNEITKGNVLVRFTNPQGGIYDLPILPSALHLHTPLSSVCSGQM